MLKRIFLYLTLFSLALLKVSAQEDSPFVAYDVPSQNLLKFNRFLINPTFSTVREDKSYINFLHRNQSAQLEDNNQNYFLSYSGRIGDRSGVGLSLYSQRLGTLSNFGVLANYAYGIKLSDKSNFTFGANVSYYNSGFDQGRAIIGEEDPFLASLENQSLLSFQPGFNISFDKWDVGVFAENLFDYNLKSSESITEFNDKTFSSHLQYTYQFENGNGIFEDARLMPLARVRKIGEEEVTLGGSLFLDLPKLGWVQGGYDSFYGAAAGVGFNINKRLSLGYTMEKGLSNNFQNFGLTHEISFAYSFAPNLTEDRVMLEEDFEDDLASEEEETPKDDLANSDLENLELIAELRKRIAENDLIIEELMNRQDSLESSRQSDLERRFNMVMNMVRKENGSIDEEIEKRAEELFLEGSEQSTLASNSSDDEVIHDPNTGQLIKKKGTERPYKTNGIKPVETDVVNSSSLVRTNTKNVKSRSDAQSELRAQQQDVVATRNNRQTPSNNSNTLQEKVKSKRFKDLPNVTDGYYIVANVYKGGKYMDNFISSLNDKGFDADYIDNTNNGLKYVYLKRFETFAEAKAAYASNYDGNYTGDTWIMNVDNRYSNEAYASNVNKLKNKSSKYESDVLQKDVIEKDKMAGTSPDPKTYDLNTGPKSFYLIANVFANPNNANRFVKLLNSYGLNASYFINPKNNYRYVYLKKHDSWTNALISYYSKLNDTFNDKMWIMKVAEEQMA